jgi:NAD(P)-dependent dehydrogenase (short-subunit alcohol dehydrogenase family)
MSFKDKVVIVTGSGKGIGHSIALTYATAGARVILAEKDPEAGKDAEEMIKSAGGMVKYVKTDISDPEDIINMIGETVRLFGTIDILINNAGISKWVSPYDLTVEDWDAVLNTNLRGTFLCSRGVAGVMKENGGGFIVNIASTRAFMSEPASEAYAASKGGIVSLTHALAASFAGDHIRVNCISPGWIETGDYGKLRDQDHKQHLSGRVGKPEDIARACLYLTSPGNEFVTGANLVIDGGMTRKMIYEP